jgi:hypothetical protein
MGTLLIQIAEEQPDLILETQIDVEDYGLQSWRKMGAALYAAAGMHESEIMEYGRWKSLEFTKYARVRQHDATEHVRGALAQNLELL